MSKKSSEGEYEVFLYVYDLSNGLAKSLSLPLIGKQVIKLITQISMT